YSHRFAASVSSGQGFSGSGVASQNFTVPCGETLPSRWPSGLKATLPPPHMCALRLSSSWPVCASHNFIMSVETLARHLPSGLKATLATWPLCPLKVSSSWPVCASHTFTSPGSPVLIEARRLPSGLNVTEANHPVGCWIVSSSWPVCASHTISLLGEMLARR